MSVKKVHEYTHEQVIPNLAGHFLDMNWSEDEHIFFHHTVHNDIISISNKEVLKFYDLHEFFIMTVYNWTKILGMEYCNHKNNNYFNGHKRKDVINAR